MRATGPVVVLLALIGLLAACGGDDDADTGGAAQGQGPPYVVETDWGTFRLKPSIADKVKAHKPVNYVFSYAGAGTPLFSDQYNAGYERGLDEAKPIYPLNGTKIAPVEPDANKQLAALQTKLAAGQIDCLSLSPGSPTAFNSLIDRMMDDGIPVFTAGVPTSAHEFTNFSQIPDKEGAQAARAVLDWMRDNGKDLKIFAVSTGDPTQPYSIGRIGSFIKTIKAEIPDAEFVNGDSNPLNMGYDPAAAYDTAKAFLAAHPEVEVIENVDIGAEVIAKAIADLHREGKTYTLGWNVTKGQIDAIKAGTQIALMDQRWPDQAAFGANACAQFFAEGKVLPNTQELTPYTKANLDEAAEALATGGS